MSKFSKGQSGSTHVASESINPELINNFDRVILSANEGKFIFGDDVRAIVLCMLNDFNKLAECQDIHHCLSLSQHVSPDTVPDVRPGEIPAVCLKYVDIPVCLTGSKVIPGMQGSQSLTGSKSNVPVECTFSRGLLKLGIKYWSKDKECTRHIPIEVTEVNVVTTLTELPDALYHNVEAQSNFERSLASRVGTTQSTIMNQETQSGNINMSKNVPGSAAAASSIMRESRGSVLSNQLPSMASQGLFTTNPSQSQVNTSNAVASALSSTPSSRQSNLTYVQIPSSPIPLSTSGTRVPGSIIGTEVTAQNPESLATSGPRSASLQVNSSLLGITPAALSKAVETGSVVIVSPLSKVGETAGTNPLASYAQNSRSLPTESVLQSIPQGSNVSTIPLTVVPVSNNLSVGTVGSQPAVASIIPPTSGSSNVTFGSRPSTQQELEGVASNITTTPPTSTSGSTSNYLSSFLTGVTTGVASGLGLSGSNPPGLASTSNAPVSGSKFTSQPGSMFGTQPGSMFGTQPGSSFGTQPGSMFGTQPGSMFGTQPGSMFGTQPGSSFGTQPGSMFGTQPGSQLTSQAFGTPGSFGSQQSSFGSQVSSQYTSSKPKSLFDEAQTRAIENGTAPVGTLPATSSLRTTESKKSSFVIPPTESQTDYGQRVLTSAVAYPQATGGKRY